MLWLCGWCGWCGCCAWVVGVVLWLVWSLWLGGWCSWCGIRAGVVGRVSVAGGVWLVKVVFLKNESKKNFFKNQTLNRLHLNQIKTSDPLTTQGVSVFVESTLKSLQKSKEILNSQFGHWKSFVTSAKKSSEQWKKLLTDVRKVASYIGFIGINLVKFQLNSIQVDLL